MENPSRLFLRSFVACTPQDDAIKITPMIILGIDPGTATTGFGIIKKEKNNFKIVDFGVITTKPKLPDAERLKILADDLSKLIKKYKPACVGVERLFFTTNQKTVMTVSQARGVVLYLAQKHKLPIFEFTPLQIKSFICGYGKADKKQVQYVVQKTFCLKNPPKPDDAADALAIALCAGHYYQKHSPGKQIESISKLAFLTKFQNFERIDTNKF